MGNDEKPSRQLVKVNLILLIKDQQLKLKTEKLTSTFNNFCYMLRKTSWHWNLDGITKIKLKTVTVKMVNILQIIIQIINLSICPLIAKDVYITQNILYFIFNGSTVLFYFSVFIILELLTQFTYYKYIINIIIIYIRDNIIMMHEVGFKVSNRSHWVISFCLWYIFIAL